MEVEKAPRRWVKRHVKPRTGPPVKQGMEAQAIATGHGRYVQRYARCGRGCSVCSEGGAHYSAERPGHGPYWYFELEVKGKRQRRYCGSGPMPRGLGEMFAPPAYDNEAGPPPADGGPVT